VNSAVDPDHYEMQLARKVDSVRQRFRHLATPEPEIVRSPPLHFRMRAEFRIWHEGDNSFYAMTPPGEKKPKPIDGFAIGSRPMVELMPRLLDAIENDDTLRRKLYAAEFLTTLSGEVLVTLIYHRRLDEVWKQRGRDLARTLDVHLIGRSRGQKEVLGRDYVMETLEVDGVAYRYQQVETGFTQPNAEVNRHMLAWTREVTRDSNGDLLELYCGNGNFTVALAGNFDRVLANEVSKVSVRSAHYNLEINGIGNAQVVRMSSEELTDALNGVRPFRRLRHVDLDSYRFSTIFVDPPRAGLDENTLDLVRAFDRIVYISCNPATLLANLEALADSHRIERFAVFDQFPYTEHLECGVLLCR
jgi:tRNA (uracil-5-)-methyltransferase